MADNSATSSATRVGNGGARTAGQRSAATQQAVDRDSEAIKKAWNLQEVEDAFPPSIKPTNLGVSALNLLRAISSRANDLAIAQALFLNVCKKSDGTPVPFSHGHACSVLKTLKSGETSTPMASKPDTKENIGTLKSAANMKTLKSSETSVPKAPKPNTKENTGTPKSAIKKSVASPDIPPAKVPSLIAPGSGLIAPFSIGKVQQRALEAVMVNGGAQKDVKQKSQVPTISPFIIPTIPKKRARPSKEPDAPATKKVRKEDDPFSPTKEHYSIVENKPMIEALADKTNGAPPSSLKAGAMEVLKTAGAQLSSSKVDSGAVADNKDPLDEKMAEHLRANAAFFAGSEARQAVFATDTIRVAHPEDPKSFIETEQFKAPSSSINHASLSGTQPQDWLKFHCLGLHESIRIVLPSPNSLQKIGRPDQRYLVDQAIRVIDQAINQLKTGMEHIFTEPS